MSTRNPAIASGQAAARAVVAAELYRFQLPDHVVMNDVERSGPVARRTFTPRPHRYRRLTAAVAAGIVALVAAAFLLALNAAESQARPVDWRFAPDGAVYVPAGGMVPLPKGATETEAYALGRRPMHMHQRFVPELSMPTWAADRGRTHIVLERINRDLIASGPLPVIVFFWRS